MGVKITAKASKLPAMVKNLRALQGKGVQVGCMDGAHAWLARIHEYGCNITARGKYLTIPLTKAAKGRSASSFGDLFFFTSKSGNHFLARKVSKEKIELVYLLKKSVHIPERAFLRNGYKKNRDNVVKLAANILPQVSAGNMDVADYLEYIGIDLSGRIKEYATDLSDPPNSPITKANKGSSNPLFDTGDMINGISYKIKE